ncbi:MAG: LamG-like jellyroll fold domain-containing protein [Bacteroidota bacterium]
MMKILLLLISSLIIYTSSQGQATLSALPEHGKVTLSGDLGSLSMPTHVDVYRGTTNPPTQLHRTFQPTGNGFQWVDSLLDNDVFYYYQVNGRDDNSNTESGLSNVAGAMPSADRGAYYLFDGVDDRVEQLDYEYFDNVDFMGVDIKIDELTPGKDTEIFRLEFKGTMNSNFSKLIIRHTAGELQVINDFEYSNTNGSRSVNYQTTRLLHNIADGEWHELRLIQMTNTEMTVRLDDRSYKIFFQERPLDAYVGKHDLYIGGRSNDNTTYLKGSVDNLRLFGNQILRGRWNFDEPGTESTVYDASVWSRDMRKSVGILSANDLIGSQGDQSGFHAYATNTGSTLFTVDHDLQSTLVGSFTLTRSPLLSTIIDTVLNDTNLANSFPFEEGNTFDGSPYEYKLAYTVGLNNNEDTTITVTDISVPATGFGNHYVFDGVDDRVTIDDPVIESGTGSVELMVRIEPEDKPSGFSYGLFGKHDQNSRGGFVIAHDGGTVWAQFKTDIASANLYPVPARNLADGKWHHVALTFESGNTAELYVDGTLVSSNSIPDFTFTNNSFFVALSPDDFWRPLKGRVDEVVIRENILTAESVKNKAFVKARGDEENILAVYHFDEVFHSFAYDDSPNRNHADITVTLVGQSTSEIPNRWVGYKDENWNTPGNWNNGTLPLANEEIQINSSTHDPVITSASVVDVNDLILNQGTTLTVESGGILAIKGDLTNNGSITVKRKPEATGKYSMIGSPVTDADISDFGADILVAYDPLTGDFIEATGAAFPGTGYFTAFTGASPEISLTGTPNTGEINVPLTTSIGPVSSYNLVANPYAAPINFDNFISENTGAITGAIWLWDDGGINVNDSRFGDYVTVNSMGVVTADRGSTGSVWNDNLASFQGFFVRKISTGDNLTFTPAMQVTTAGSNSDVNHFRSTDKAPIQSIKLALSNNKLYNEVIVALSDQATFDEDQNLDAPKIKGNPYFSFYTWLNDEAFAIQAVPKPDQSIMESSVPLGFDIDEPGNFQLSVVEFKNNSDEYSIFLIDHLLGMEYMLTPESVFSFSVDEAVIESRRFELKYVKQGVVTNTEEALTKNLTVYGKDNQLTINYPSFNKEKVSVYSLDGRKIFEELVEFNGRAVVPVSLENNQLYILKIDNQVVKFIIQ